MRYVKSLGTEGIEILPDQMLKGSPHISDEVLEEWNALVAETGLKPVIADVLPLEGIREREVVIV